MDVPRLLLIAAAVLVLGLAIPAAQAEAQVQDKDTVSAQSARAPGPPKPLGPPKPWKEVRGFGRVLDLSKPPVVIDEPGLYAVEHSWLFPRATADVVSELIQITADDVTLDLHGFTISADISAPPPSTLFVITGNSAEIRNGALAACCDGAVAVHSTARSGPWLHHLSIYSHETMSFEGDGASLTDSELMMRVEIALAGNSNLERNTIGCNRGQYCVRLREDGNRVIDNKLALYQSRGIAILGNRNFVMNNIVEAFQALDAGEAFVVDGDSNIVRANTVLGHFDANSIFLIGGTANTLDGNIVAPPTPAGRVLVGMQFTADGNYYGDNRMAAQVPFSLGGTVQTDWGGNVGY